MTVDLHVHSDRSDGIDGIERLAARAKELGLAAIAICDHNVCTPLPADSPVTLIPATEISTKSGHIVGLFVTKIDFETLNANGLPEAAAAIAAIHEAGGLAVLAHPFETGRFTERDLDGLEFDLIETANARADMKYPDANDRAARYAKRRGIPAVGGSDAHSAKELGACVTELDGEPEQALRAGRTSAGLYRRCSPTQKAKGRVITAFRRKRPKMIAKALLYYLYALLREIRKG